jgi:2-keto-3-deoxy-L-rhamnonate aldolase RhmA
MRRTNPLRELLNAGKPSLGTRLHSAWPTVIELVGYSEAFDYVEITAEYAPYDLFSLENQGRAIELFPRLSGLVKIEQESRMHLAVRAMSSGIQNLLFTDVRTPEDTRECVRCVRAETPGLDGLHGVGQGRDVGIVLEVGNPHFVQTTKDAVVALMIEKKEAIENLEAILDVPGIDMVQFGPADYAMGIGVTGDRQHPAVREAEDYMIATALKKGIAPRAEIRDPEAAKPYMAKGVRHFCMGTDVRILFDFYKGRGSDLRDLVTGGGA